MFPRISAVRGATIRATAVIASTFFLRTRTRTFCFVDNTIFSRGAGAAFSRQVARVAFTGSTRGTSLPSYTQPSRMSTSAVPKESMASAAAPKFVVAACQILCGGDRASNIASAEQAVKDAAAAGAQVVVLPECWNSPYDTASFPLYAEPVPDPRTETRGTVTSAAQAPADIDQSPSTSMLRRAAAENKIYLVGGSVPEKVAVCNQATVGAEQQGSGDGSGDGGKASRSLYYNTCVVCGPDGEILAKHRKVHLFDIDVPGGISFKESDTLSPGNEITTVDTPFGKIGVGICYDMRFPELSMAMRAAGAKVLCFPGAFNMTTGPAHWELLQRARAVDNQCYVVTASPARNPDSTYQAWGHSSIVDPWGRVVATTEHASAMVLAEVDMEQVDDIRKSIPVSLQKRADLYRLELP